MSHMEGDVVSSFRESVSIAAHPDVVWGLISDIPRHVEFAGPKSITKAIEFEGELAVGARWIAHEKFGPQKFDAPSEVTAVDHGRLLEWVSYPPVKRDEDRGKGGRVIWGYVVTPDDGGTRLEHSMSVLEPKKGAAMLKALYKVMSLPRKQREGGLTTLRNIKAAAERSG